MSYLNEEVAMERVIVNGHKCMMLSTVPKKSRTVRKAHVNPTVVTELAGFSTPDLMSMLADPDCRVGKSTNTAIKIILDSRGL